MVGQKLGELSPGTPEIDTLGQPTSIVADAGVVDAGIALLADLAEVQTTHIYTLRKLSQTQNFLPFLVEE